MRGQAYHWFSSRRHRRRGGAYTQEPLAARGSACVFGASQLPYAEGQREPAELSLAI